MDETVKRPEEWRPLPLEGFFGQLGPLLTRRLNGVKCYGLQTDDRHRNAIDLVHGGLLTGLLDQVIALEAWRAADRKPTVTVQLDTRFLSAARPGDFVEAAATLRHATRTLLFVDAEVTGPAGLLATATAVMKITNREG